MPTIVEQGVISTIVIAIIVLSSSPLTMVVAAINDSVIIPSNPSMALTGVVVTSTFNPDQHSYNSTGYDVGQDQIEYSEYNKMRQGLNFNLA